MYSVVVFAKSTTVSFKPVETASTGQRRNGGVQSRTWIHLETARHFAEHESSRSNAAGRVSGSKLLRLFIVRLYDNCCSPWASGRTGDTGWPDSSTAENAPDVKDSQWPTPAQPSLTDLVPEFEPGKPWKVMKSANLGV